MRGVNISNLVGSARRLLRNSRGNILVITAAGLPVLVGAAGLGTDTVQWYLWKRQLQQASDSGALAGAYADALGATEDGVKRAVDRSLTKNQNVALLSKSVTSTTVGGQKRVSVALTTRQALPFSSMFLPQPPTISTSATAAIVGNGEHCIVSLEDTSVSGIITKGNAEVNLGCGVATNSRGNDAISAGGSSRIVATPLTAVGGIPSSSSIVTQGPLQPYSIPQADPLAHLVPPTFSHASCKDGDFKPKKGETETIQTDNGKKCFSGLSLAGQGTIKLSPGIYIIAGGTLDFGAQGTIVGTDVVFYLTKGSDGTYANIKGNGGATLRLTAPTLNSDMPQRAYAGVLFFQDRAAPSGVVNKINGGAGAQLQGALYFPAQTLAFTGNSGANTACLQFVARKVEFSGNTNIQNHCPADSGAGAYKAQTVQLIK